MEANNTRHNFGSLLERGVASQGAIRHALLGQS